jgi:uncharacterized protein involved in response to NO
MVLWIGLVSGLWQFANAYGAVAWHAHEFLFGYVSAVLTGFLLTAIPNWTGRLPLQGLPLLALCLLWAAGRAAMLATDQIGVVAAAAVDCAYLPTPSSLCGKSSLAETGEISRSRSSSRCWRSPTSFSRSRCWSVARLTTVCGLGRRPSSCSSCWWAEE